MAANTVNGSGRRGNRWRMATWGTAAALLLLPWVAMQLSAPGVLWTGSDFVVMGVVLAVACGTYELGAWLSGNGAYRAAFGVAVVAGFLLVWINLAVGIIGDEHDRANLLFGGVLAIGIIGALIARFQAQGMARALVATAIAQVLIGVTALAAGWGYEAAALGGFFGALWLTSAGLFRKAAREQTPGTPRLATN
ncbi:MAG: hypothetical protein WKF61_02130 [Luteimonas sp.]